MHDNTNKANIVTKKASYIGIISIVVCIIIIIVAMFGEEHVKIFNTILAIIMIISGIINTTVKREKDLEKVGVRLVFAGWLLLPIGAAGFLLSMSEYYTMGLGGMTRILVLGYLITTILGAYELFYSNKELGTPLAP